jgi:hypothetical protein
MVIHMQAYITSDMGSGCFIEYSIDGGTNWVSPPLYDSTGIGGDAGVVDRYQAYNNVANFDPANVVFRITADWNSGDAYGDQSIRIYEAYVTYSGFYTANLTNTLTTTPLPVYSTNKFSTTTGTMLPTNSTPNGYDTALEPPVRLYFYLESVTENP